MTLKQLYSLKILLTFVLFLAAFSGVFSDFAVVRCDEPNVAVETQGDENQTANVEIQTLTVGIDGVWKNGFQTPITVSFDGSGSVAAVELETVDSDGTPFRMRKPSPETSLDSESSSVRLYMPLGRANGDLTVRLLGTRKTVETSASQSEISQSNDETATSELVVLDEKTFSPSPRKTRTNSDENSELETEKIRFYSPIPPQKPIYLIVGAENVGLNEVFGELRLKEEKRPFLRRVRQISELPEDAISYEAVETIVLTTTDPEFFNGVAKTDPRILALNDWVRFGGKLVISAGRNALPLICGDGPLVDLTPGTPDSSRLREIRIANELVQFVPKAKNLVMTGTLDFPFLNVPILTNLPKESIVDIAEMETPLLVRTPRGFGSVVFFAIDLAEAPLSGWNGRSGLIVRAFGFDVGNSSSQTTDNSIVRLGYSDLSGQIRSVLDRFDGVRIVPFSLVLLLMFLYILIIGPGDWFLTRKILKRPNLTWLTFPVYVVVFCAIVVGIERSTRPNEVRVNQLDLVDVDIESGIVRGTVWNGVYSPSDQEYSLQLSDSPLFSTTNSNSDRSSSLQSNRVYFSWFGLQGSGLGGMSPKTVSTRLWNKAYQFGDPSNVLQNVPIPIRSSKSFFGRYFSEYSGSIPQSSLKSQDSVPVGTIVNPFDVPVENAVLFYQRWAINLGTLEPGETTIDAKRQRLEINRVLNGSTQPFDDSAKTLTQQGLARYNTQSNSLPYILRTALFYQLAGGSNSVGLDNSSQPYLDGSELVRSGRAVLIGTIRDASPSIPLAELSNDQDGRISYGGRVERISGSRSDSNSTATLLGNNQETDQNRLNRRTVFVRLVLPVEK